MPSHTVFLPVFEPFHLGSRLAEELHFHLFELSHTEYKLAGYYLITECFAYLTDAERQLHAACFLYVEVVYEDALCCFRTQINSVGLVAERANFGRKHQVELANISPILCTTDGINDAFVENYLFQGLQIRALHGLGVTFMQCITLFLVLQYAWIGLAELTLFKTVSKLLGSLGNFFFNLFIVLCHLILNEDISTIAFL